MFRRAIFLMLALTSTLASAQVAAPSEISTTRVRERRNLIHDNTIILSFYRANIATFGLERVYQNVNLAESHSGRRSHHE